MFREAATPQWYHTCLFSCLVSRTLPTVCAADGGTKGRCLQDFELMESRQGLGMDTWQVISCKPSVGGKKERLVIFYTLKKKGDILHLAWTQCNIISQLCFFCLFSSSVQHWVHLEPPEIRFQLWGWTWGLGCQRHGYVPRPVVTSSVSHERLEPFLDIPPLSDPILCTLSPRHNTLFR